MHRLKICCFLKWYPRLSQMFILNKILRLQQQGVSITIAALKGSDEGTVHERVQAFKIPIYHLVLKKDWFSPIAFEQVISLIGDLSERFRRKRRGDF